MKCILIICDGMGDRPSPNYPRTPLEVADTPALDQLAANGAVGILDIIAPGIRPGSDTAHLALFGYDPYIYYKGRGPFEAIGANIPVNPGEVTFRANFATIDSKNVIVDRRAGRVIPHADQFAELLDNLTLPNFPDVKITFVHTIEHRCVLKIQDANLSHEVSDMDPDITGVEVNPCYALSDNPAAKRTAAILNEFFDQSKQILQKSPLNQERAQKNLLLVNSVLSRGAGIVPELEPLTLKYKINAACIAGAPLYKGVAQLVGMSIVDVPEATGTVETNTLAKGRAALQSLVQNDLIFIHIKGTDSASHDGNFPQKVMMLEKIDAMVRLLIDTVDLNETLIAITADHANPVSVQDHTADPVPLAIIGKGILTDEITTFSERACARGGLGRLRGVNLMPILMDLMNKSKKFGA